MTGKKTGGLGMSGHCAHPAVNRDSHKFCYLEGCGCDCHTKDRVFSGRGILFAIIDDRETMRTGGLSSVEIISKAIDEALDNGHDDSESIARYITTHSFNHVKERRARFNSVLKASDTVGAQIVRKLINSYNEMMELAEGEEGREREDAEMEARGFAAAIQIVLSPFSCEDGKDPRVVKWAEVDRLTELFENEQANIRKERQGSPQ